MINISRKRTQTRTFYLLFGIVLAVSLPLAFFAGWMADLSQIRPVLTQLGHAQPKVAAPPVSGSEEPPTGIPQLRATWGNSQVLLTWTRVAGAKTYTVYRSMGNLGYSHAQVIGQLSQSTSQIAFADFSLTPGRHYTYWVAAGNRAGLGPISQALSGRTFFSSSVIAHNAEKAAVWVQAQSWSQGGMGLLVPADHIQSALAFNIDHVLYTPLYLPPSISHSNWLTKRWIRWKNGNTRLGVLQSFHHLTLLQGLNSPKRPSLPLGHLNTDNVAVWRQRGHWQYKKFQRTIPTLPADAIVLNGYGQACAMTNASGPVIFLHPLSLSDQTSNR